MKLTKEEEKICLQYGAPDESGKAHCSECPLLLDMRYGLCKAYCTEEEWDREERRMAREEIKKKLQIELNSIYCLNCRYQDGGAHCDYCHRKYMAWRPSDQLLEWIMDVCGVKKEE